MFESPREVRWGLFSLSDFFDLFFDLFLCYFSQIRIIAPKIKLRLVFLLNVTSALHK